MSRYYSGVQDIVEDGGRTRVIAVEDDPRYRESLETLLRYAAEFTLVRSYASPGPALADLEAGLRRGLPPGFDLVLMDIELPGMSGVEATRRIKEMVPGMRVVALTVYEDRHTILEAICAGADGYLLKRTPADRLLAQLRSVLAGGSPLSASVARTVLDFVRGREGREGSGPGTLTSGSRPELTPREEEVLTCLVNGLSYKQVARQLDVSIDTVRFHIRNVYGKLQVRSVAQAVSRALREGLV